MRNKTAEFEFLLAAGHRQVSVIPPPSCLNHFGPNDKDDLYKQISLTMDVIAQKQLNIFRADKLPSREELENPKNPQSSFKNSYIVTEIPASRPWQPNQYAVYYIDEKGKEHKLGLTSEEVRAHFAERESGMLALGRWGWNMDHLTSPTRRTIQGGTVQRLNLSVNQLKCMKKLIAQDPHMPREPGTNEMCLQSALSVGNAEEVTRMQTEIQQLATSQPPKYDPAKLSLEQADMLLKKLDVLVHDRGRNKNQVLEPEATRQNLEAGQKPDEGTLTAKDSKDSKAIPSASITDVPAKDAKDENAVPTVSSDNFDRSAAKEAKGAATMSSTSYESKYESKEESKEEDEEDEDEEETVAKRVAAIRGGSRPLADSQAEKTTPTDEKKGQGQVQSIEKIRALVLASEVMMREAVAEAQGVNQGNLQDGIEKGIKAIEDINHLIQGDNMSGKVLPGQTLDPVSDQRQAEVLKNAIDLVKSLEEKLARVEGDQLREKLTQDLQGQIDQLKTTLKYDRGESHPSPRTSVYAANSAALLMNKKFDQEVALRAYSSVRFAIGSRGSR